ncbi:apolipoprotein D-like [Clavelina lepadiformis]|uniref:apolipoprotein D-like n=1 Tax=Clavelina lepadiformis TaxID=159417 RepID=UPI00404249A2
MRAEITVFVLIIAFGFVTKAQVFDVTLTPRCAEVELMAKLKAEKLDGQWYEISRSPNPWERGNCIQVRHWLENGTKWWMHWEQLIPGFDKQGREVAGRDSYDQAYSIGTPQNVTANISMQFIWPRVFLPLPFYILSTDYENYYLAYSCFPYFFNEGPLKGIPFLAESAWIMSRKRSMDIGLYFVLKNKLEENGINVSVMEISKHSNCNYEMHRDNSPTVQTDSPKKST